jgi:hypothetical protein
MLTNRRTSFSKFGRQFIFTQHFNCLIMTTNIKEVNALLLLEFILSKLMAPFNEPEVKKIAS